MFKKELTEGDNIYKELLYDLFKLTYELYPVASNRIMTSKNLDYSKILGQIPQFIPYDYSMYIHEFKHTLYQKLSNLSLESIDFLQCKLPQFTI